MKRGDKAPAVTRDPPADVIYAMVWALAIAWLLVLCCGCVTRTTVCVEAARGLGPRAEHSEPHTTTGASVCAEFERP